MRDDDRKQFIIRSGSIAKFYNKNYVYPLMYLDVDSSVGRRSYCAYQPNVNIRPTGKNIRTYTFNNDNAIIGEHSLKIAVEHYTRTDIPQTESLCSVTGFEAINKYHKLYLKVVFCIFCFLEQYHNSANSDWAPF